MEAVRESWTDERMDDLKEQVVEQGRRVEARFESLETRMEARFESLETRIDSSQRTMVQLFGIMFATFVGLISAQTALLLALL